jgi:nicotinamide mononucleotide transporter
VTLDQWLEAMATVLGIAMVVCNIRVIHWGWPLAFVSSALSFFVMWNSKLYANAWLQVFFAAMALWGWTQWLRGRRDDGTALRIERLAGRGRMLAVLAWAVLWPATVWLLANHTDSTVPWWDAFPTAGSVVGTLLLARKYIENWAAWIVVNVASVGLFASQGLWWFVGLYTVFIVMAVVGWRAWRAKLAA